MAGNINDENEKKKQEEATPQPPQQEQGGGFGDDFLSQLGLDLGEISGAVEEIITDQPQEQQGADIIRETGSGIELAIDEELDSQIDEESKMFLADKHFRANEFYEALIPALELNIRVRQGRSKRDDVLVRRQNEILFESNYQLGKYHLVQASKTSGDMATHHRLMGLMHLYGAIDQNFMAGQEAKRKEIGQLWKNLIYGYRFGQYYVKYGLFSTLTIPGPEDHESKAEFWSFMGNIEKEPITRELYMLMAYSYDLSYFRYQVRLASYYVEIGKPREGTRYIQVPLPGIEDDGMSFLQALLKKAPHEFEKFVTREFNKDIKRLTSIAEETNYKHMLDIMTDWRFRLTSMKQDVPFKNSTLRLEYLKSFQKLIDEILKTTPNLFIDQTLNEYKRSMLVNKIPIVQEFVYNQLFYAVEVNEKSKDGMNVFDIDSDAFLSLVYAVGNYFQTITSTRDGEKSAEAENHKIIVRKAFSRLQSALGSKGYTVTKEPKLTL